jgi:hypothetical protein
MIRSNAASVGAYWERLLALLLEQRQVAGREPPSEQQSEGQQGYLAESLLHLHHHRAPTTVNRRTAIRRTAIRFTGILLTAIQPMAIQGIHPQAMDIQATRLLLVTPAPRPMATKATRDTPLIPVRRVIEHRATEHSLLIPISRATNIRAPRSSLLMRVSGSGYSRLGSEGYRSSEDWPAGAEHAGEPSTRVSA